MVRIALFLTGLLLVVPVGVLAQEPGLGPGDPMPGSDLPLQDRGGRSVTLSALRGERATVVLFWSNTCPWTRAYRDRLERLARAEEGHGVVFVFVNANDAEAFP
ncbi:MAG: thioredoxin family protein, partial [Bacteroidetes bacterium]